MGARPMLERDMRRSRGESVGKTTRLEGARAARVLLLPDGPRYLVGDRGPRIVGIMSDAPPEVREQWLGRDA